MVFVADFATQIESSDVIVFDALESDVIVFDQMLLCMLGIFLLVMIGIGTQIFFKYLFSLSYHHIIYLCAVYPKYACTYNAVLTATSFIHCLFAPIVSSPPIPQNMAWVNDFGNEDNDSSTTFYYMRTRYWSHHHLKVKSHYQHR